MIPSTATDEPRESQRQAAELAAMRRMLEMAHGTFSLSTAICNSPALRDELIAGLSRDLPWIEVVGVPPGTVDVFAAVAERAADPQRAAMFVIGLEQSVDATQSEQPALRAVNAARERWESTYRCPVVFWIPDFVARLMARHARDFWRYRSHRFEFVSAQATATAGMADRFTGDLDAAGNLDADEARFRIDELEQRLADLPADPPRQLSLSATAWLTELAFLCHRRGDLNLAGHMVRKALAINEKLGRLEGMASDYGNLGLIYKTRGDLDQAEQMHRKALEIDEKLGRLEGMSAEYGNLGLIHQARGDMDQAEQMHRKALEIDEKLGRLKGMASQYSNLGATYLMRGDLDLAEQVLRKALAIEEKLGRPEGMARAYGNFGLIHQTRGDLDQAEQMHRKALAINEKLRRLEGMAIQYGNLGALYKQRGDNAAAREHWRKAVDLYKRIGMPHMVAKTEGLIDGLPEEATSASEGDRPAKRRPSP